MARTTPDTWGPWPSPPPFSEEAVVAVWLDGSLASAVTAGWVARRSRSWRAIAVHIQGRPRRAHEAALALAIALDQEPLTLTTLAPFAEPAGWGLAHHVAIRDGADWLAVGETREALALAGADTALRAIGFGGIWAPIIGEDATSLARLALALEIPLAHTWDCMAESACGICPGCLDRSRAFKQLGMPDPAT